MGREISCEIALKKGTKRERISGGDRRETKRPMDTPSEASAIRKGVATISTQRSESLPRARDQVPAGADVDTKADTLLSVSEEESKLEATAIEGDPSKGSGIETKPPEASATGMESLSKQEAKKIVRKAAKKELKQKAKDRAREKKAVQTIKREVTSVGADRGDIEEDESVGGESLDPKAAKLNERARTVLVFGVADDLTAKQLLKRVKKVRRSYYKA